MRTVLINTYLDFRNNYLTISLYAEHNHLYLQQAIDLIALAKNVYESVNPEC